MKTGISNVRVLLLGLGALCMLGTQASQGAASNGDEIAFRSIGGTSYVIHSYTTVGDTYSFTPPNALDVEYLVVAGGGGGGRASAAGGGGAGGFRAGTLTNVDNEIDVWVGAGGLGETAEAVGTNGGNSALGLIESIGGGRGGGSVAAGSGGSGGGRIAFGAVGSAGQGTAGQGHGGGTGAQLNIDGTQNATRNAGGGGGGAGGAGTSPSGTSSGSNEELYGPFNLVFGNGGDGLPSSITGEELWYAGGGGGGRAQHPGGELTSFTGYGGEGGGGDGGLHGASGQPGLDNTGGGGGGSGRNGLAGGDGGSGIVVIRYELGDVNSWDSGAGYYALSGQVRRVLADDAVALRILQDQSLNILEE